MKLRDTVTDSVLRSRLASMAGSGLLGHALMLHEDPGGGGLALAVALAQLLLCRNPQDGDSCGVCASCSKVSRLVHPDLHFAFPVCSDRKLTSEAFLEQWRGLWAENPYFTEQEWYAASGSEGKSGAISVAEAKRIIERLNLTALEGHYKIMVVWLPERMNAEAANRLLKILEEPYDGTVFILVTQAPEKVLQTISSRCRFFRVPPMKPQEMAPFLEGRYGLSREQALSLAVASGGSFGMACALEEGRDDAAGAAALFRDLFTAASRKSLYDVIAAGENIAAVGSRDRQKAFCAYAAQAVRKIYMLRSSMEDIAGIPASEAAFYREAAARVPEGFCEKIIPHIDRAYMLVERNVNAKILFCDLADRFYTYM